MEESLDLSLKRALLNAETQRSTTTLATLAQSLEAVGDQEAASKVAIDLLVMSEPTALGELIDPIATRIAIGVLLRAGEVQRALEFARRLPLSATTMLMIGSALAEYGLTREAHEFVDAAEAPESSAVLGYLFLVEGRYSEAAPKLRQAVHVSPDDADSAHNLSIALSMLGSRKKAVSAALQARRSAPGREDISLHYFELLLAEGENSRVDREVSDLIDSGVVPSSRVYIIQARARLGSVGFGRAESVLERALGRAQEEGNLDTVNEVQSNLIRLRASNGKLDRELAVEELAKLHKEHPQSLAIVVNLAQATFRKGHADSLKKAFLSVKDSLSTARRAFIEYQLATLEGDTSLAAEKAVEWVKHEPRSPQAYSAALVALGIGSERWAEASDLANDVLRAGWKHPFGLNNVAYVFSMHGSSSRAIDLLEPIVDSDFVIKATLGLSYLASGDLEKGMRLYREAARQAEKRRDDSYCLMACYQALVVRQLGILDREDASVVAALALTPVEMPHDWEDRPEFLRLHEVAMRNGYAWPLEL